MTDARKILDEYPDAPTLLRLRCRECGRTIGRVRHAGAWKILEVKNAGVVRGQRQAIRQRPSKVPVSFELLDFVEQLDTEPMILCPSHGPRQFPPAQIVDGLRRGDRELIR